MAHNDLVQSLVRGLDVLEFVVASGGEVTLKEVCTGLGLKRPTAYNLLRTLTARGFLAKSESPPRYRPGESLGGLLAAYSRRDYLQRGAEAISELSGEYEHATVTLAECIRGQVVSVLRMSPERPGFLERPQGRVLHPYGSASAMVFQAYWNDDEREVYRRRHPFWEYGAHLWKSPEQLDEVLVGVRRDGYAAPNLRDGVLAVSAPVMARGGELAAALGLAHPTEGLAVGRRREIIAKVAARAAALSKHEEGGREA
jgi:DNA-binding IclR family transcriptional regulator